MRSRYAYELQDDGTRHFDLSARHTQNYFEFFSLETNDIVTMGGNSSSKEYEPVQAGVTEKRIVQLTRCKTPFPSKSRGSWNGGIYQIVGAGVVMYQSKEVPGPLRNQLGSGSVRFEGKYATITFNRHDGNLAEYFY